ncbi:hypothetical protein NLU13_8555 [Sarocladium strictum]|uniref:GmrSD restriction endonucleases C-terminal domain-containing protein n=1 Tax=Sarocladium strictum TaxID=5046 RepID=A0AA39L5C3_SARSR|nr:hypothetical protein NLU13_8555 [Sarocladium strictum]
MKFFIPTLLSVATTVLAVPIPVPDPPGIPSSSSASTLLAGLTVRAWSNVDTYDRDLFPHWVAISGNCNAREYVLKRDGTNVVVNSACVPQSGTWRSPYDAETTTSASDLDIDHMVPLKNAWISGAASWTTSKRQDFANDVSNPQLWAVTAGVNRSKGDKSPDSWVPPLASFHCTYAKSWIKVKSTWALSVTSAEKAALSDLLDKC